MKKIKLFIDKICGSINVPTTAVEIKNAMKIKS